MTASPPWAVTAAAISGVSVATATRPMPAASARRSTWTIIGRPAMSSSGLPGSRVAAMRAGNQHQRAGFGHRGEVRGPGKAGGKWWGLVESRRRLYGLPERGQTDISSLLGGAVRKPDS